VWIYESTNAFGPPAGAASSTGSAGNTSASDYDLGTVGSVAYRLTQASATSLAFDRWGTSGTTRVSQSVSNRTVGANYDSDGGVFYETFTNTGSTLQVTESSSGSFGYTGSGSTVLNGVGTTTTSFATTAPVSRDSRATGTTTYTGTAGAETTTTQTATATEVSTAAGPTTTAATVTVTQTTSTASGGTATTTSTSYLYAPSTTITAPDSWVKVSDAAASEQAWEITATAESAGYVSQLGQSFTRRTGLFFAESTVLPVAAPDPTRTMVWSVTSAAAYPTYTTTRTTSTVDTYKPAGSIYPVTATSTRTLELITTATTLGAARFLYSETTETVVGEYPGSSMGDSTVRTTVAVSAPITYNVNGTATVAGSFHVTHDTTTAVRLFQLPPPHATSSTASATTASTYTATDSVSFSISSTFSGPVYTTITSETDTTTVVTVTESGTYTASGYTIDTITTTVFNGGNSYTEGCGVPFAVVSGSYLQTIGATTETVYSTITHDAPNPHTITEETYAAYTVTADGSYAETLSSSSSATSATATTAETTTYGYTDSTYTESVSDFSNVVASYGTSITQQTNESQGISLTWPTLYPQATFAFSTPWTAHAFHPRQGFSVQGSTGLFSGLSLAGGGSLFYPFRATQLDQAGPAIPLLFVGLTTYANGASTYAVSVNSAASALSYTMGATATATSSALLGTVTSTFSATVTTSTASGSAAFAGENAATWYAAQSSAVESVASRIGGVAARSSYGLAVYYPPGVRHWTTQTVDASGVASTVEETAWITALSTRAASNEAHALPRTVESVFSVFHPATSFYAAGAFSLSPLRVGATAAPVVTLSKFPGL